MKKQFLTGIAALFLATGTAHAYPPRYYDCGKVFLKIQTGAGTAHPSGRRVFPTTWTVAENTRLTQDRDDAKNVLPLSLKCIENKALEGKWDDKCSYNGKLCRKMSDEKGKEEFGDED
jgi:hypothetical protein